MKSSLWASLILLAVIIAGGIWSSSCTQELSDRYISAAEEIRTLIEARQWQRAEEVAMAYEASWQSISPRLQMLIDHSDADAIAMSLKHIRAGLHAQDAGMCYLACAELREHAHHLHHREAFTLSNVL